MSLRWGAPAGTARIAYVTSGAKKGPQLYACCCPSPGPTWWTVWLWELREAFTDPDSDGDMNPTDSDFDGDPGSMPTCVQFVRPQVGGDQLVLPGHQIPVGAGWVFEELVLGDTWTWGPGGDSCDTTPHPFAESTVWTPLGLCVDSQTAYYWYWMTANARWGTPPATQVPVSNMYGAGPWASDPPPPCSGSGFP